MNIVCRKCTLINPIELEYCSLCNNNLKEQTFRTKKQKIEDNYLKAYERIPESLFQINMLYFKCSINGIETKAFIDTGAQMTIMTYEFCEKIKLLDLIDTRFKSTAYGVGKQAIIGKIHYQEIDIQDKGISLPCSFSILKDMDVDIIFGLDMLISHGILLDLKHKCMRIGDICIEFI